MITHSQRLYICDNGRTLCGNHLGASARMTGRDISGQPILEVTRAVIAEARSMNLPPLVCEDCGRPAVEGFAADD